MRESGHITLAGRRIGFACYGAANGIPVTYCHGTPSSRLEAQLAAAAARDLGITLIAIDRPGYGLSDPLQADCIAAWPEDTAAVANHLGIERFHVIGVSGGGPYALACGWRLRKRIKSIALVCPLGPVANQGLRRPMSPAARLAFFLAEKAPWALPIFFGDLTAWFLRRHPKITFALLESHLPEPDRQTLADPAICSLFEASVREALHRGSAGALRDFIHFVRPWGFDPAHIRQKVTLWHGDLDAVVPPSHSQHISRMLPQAKLRLIPGEGHFSLPVNRAETILAHLVNGSNL